MRITHPDTPTVVKAGQESWHCSSLTVHDIDEAIWSHQAHLTDFLRLVRDNAEIHPVQSGTRNDGYLWCYRHFQEGYSLIINHAERLLRSVFDDALALADTLDVPVASSIFLTPPSAQAFGTHYDILDVFMLQITGSKRWIVHQPSVPNPTARQRWAVDSAPEGAPCLEHHLAPGEGLFVPRGYFHRGEAQLQPSLHVSFTVHALTGEGLLKALLEAEVDDNPALRSNVATSGPLDSIDSAFHGLRRRDQNRDSWYSNSQRRIHTACRPVRGGGLFRHAHAPLTPSTRLEKYLGRSCAYEFAGPECVLVFLPAIGGYAVDGDSAGRRPQPSLRLPSALVPALEFIIASEEPFRGSDLPGLEPDEGFLLAKQLARAGYLIPALPRVDGAA